MGDEKMIAGKALARLSSVEVVGERKLLLNWQSGTTTEVDVTAILESRSVYRALLFDEDRFRSLNVSEYGTAAQWDGGIEISAAWLARLPDAASPDHTFV